MKVRASKTKGLLIFTLFFALFLLAMEFTLFGLIEITRQRVIRLKRRQTAESMADVGVTFGKMMREKHGNKNPVAIFPKLSLKKEIVLEGSYYTRYSYTSPDLLNNGSFTLQYFYRDNRFVKLVSKGNYEGITVKKPAILK
ncbi:MAG: hypothetical protein K8T10_17405 [Candidatus Eremiobacteraeota bacterium]|nr:hypothetical protein [Candidatus Eremiobacteraeota bacterium]